MKAPVALALDAKDLETAKSWAQQAGPFLSTMKIGLETYLREGKKAVQEISQISQCDIFLDLKLHDIPATVAGACRSVANLKPKYLTVHASGGTEMIKAAVEQLPDTLITAVTILTSLNSESLTKIGFRNDPLKTSVELAKLAMQAGARALVCSALEVSEIRKNVSSETILITPGIRPSGTNNDDQQRTATPKDALLNGANLLVIGRPITASASIDSACKEIVKEINSVYL